MKFTREKFGKEDLVGGWGLCCGMMLWDVGEHRGLVSCSSRWGWLSWV